ncbi:MAG TPA: anti-sigma regulatory factor [Acidimicrobiales bacterium]|nr:anti-sigma regulatory factor [Acidimicrobiales bacterium]
MIAADTDILAARRASQELGRAVGFSLTELTFIATAISEVARNILSYAGWGEIRLALEERSGRAGLVVEATDHGPGIANVGAALQNGYQRSSGGGIGLPGAKKLMDEFEIRSIPGQGTTVTMRKWVAAHAAQ